MGRGFGSTETRGTKTRRGAAHKEAAETRVRVVVVVWCCKASAATERRVVVLRKVPLQLWRKRSRIATATAAMPHAGSGTNSQ